MTNTNNSDFSSAARKIATGVRLDYVQGYLATGRLDLAAQNFMAIDPMDANEPEVVSVRKELERLQRRDL